VKQGLTDPDDVPAPPDEAITQPGDLWMMGDHRLLCGDAGSTEDVDRLLDGQPVHLINTDPPYNVKVEPRSNTRTQPLPDFPVVRSSMRNAELFSVLAIYTCLLRIRHSAICIRPVPCDVAEANASQSGKTYRHQKIVAAALSPSALKKLRWRILNSLLNAAGDRQLMERKARNQLYEST